MITRGFVKTPARELASHTLLLRPAANQRTNDVDDEIWSRCEAVQQPYAPLAVAISDQRERLVALAACASEIEP
jgi:hypothetical protein